MQTYGSCLFSGTSGHHPAMSESNLLAGNWCNLNSLETVRNMATDAQETHNRAEICKF